MTWTILLILSALYLPGFFWFLLLAWPLTDRTWPHWSVGLAVVILWPLIAASLVVGGPEDS